MRTAKSLPCVGRAVDLPRCDLRTSSQRGRSRTNKTGSVHASLPEPAAHCAQKDPPGPTIPMLSRLPFYSSVARLSPRWAVPYFGPHELHNGFPCSSQPHAETARCLTVGGRSHPTGQPMINPRAGADRHPGWSSQGARVIRGRLAGRGSGRPTLPSGVGRGVLG